MHVVLFSQRKEYNKEEEYLECISSHENFANPKFHIKNGHTFSFTFPHS